MRLVGDIALDAEVRAIASGAITDGGPVIVNSAGNVSAIGTNTITQDVGTAAVFESAYAFDMDSVYDISNDKTIIFYHDNDNNGYLTAVVVTHASDGGLTYTTPVVAHSVQAYYVAASYDVAQAGKTVVYWRDQADPYPGKALVATLSGTSLSFGSAVTFNSTQSNYMVSSYDTNAEKHVVIYTDIQGAGRVSARVGTVSGTSISFGTEAVVRNHNNVFASIVYDSNAQKHVCIWRDGGDSRGNSGYANVGTISGTDISFGSDTQFETGAVTNGDRSLDIQFDSLNNKVIIFYYDEGNSNYGTAVVGTVSGTSISFGTPVVFESATSPDYIRASFDTNVNKFLVAYRAGADGSKGKFRIATISGTSVSFTDSTTFNSGGQTQPYSVVFDPDIKRHIIPYHDTSNNNYGTAISVRVAGETASNLTSENFIGFAHAAYADGQKATVKTTGSIARNIPQVGSASDVLSSASTYGAISTSPVLAVDTANNRIVIAGRDGSYGTGKAIVGTIDTSNDTVSFGSFAEFEDGNNTENFQIVFDSNSNKVVIVYSDGADSSKGKAVVGTVSGTSISFGTIVEFESGATSNIAASFDSNSNKVVIVYKDGGNSFYFTSIVGTVSGTDISFGTAVVIVSSNYSYFCNTFDSSNNKVVVGLRGASSHGQAYVGTVSGTSISWGTVATFHTSAQPRYMDAAFDTNVNKVIFSYHAGGDSSKGYAVVGTVSGTDITFGTPTKFHDAATSEIGIAFDSTTNKFLIAYKDDADSDKGKYITGSISGTTPSFGSETVLDSGRALQPTVEYDTGNKKTIINYRDTSGVGTIKLFSHTGSPEDLTIGQQYFVQTDGSLDTSADDPSVIAGTAIGASDIIVKG